MKRIVSLVFCYILIFGNTSCGQSFDIQGHRGARGLMPENSIPGFIRAIDLGVTTVEMDVVISGDGKVVVSHDPYISSKFCVNELGRAIKKKEESQINIYNMLYEDVVLFDCGAVGNPNFPEQEKLSVSKPLLSVALKACEEHIEKTGRSAVQYNIELKSRPSWDGIYHPDPNLYTELVYDVVKNAVPKERICIQSFDFRILHYWRLKYPDYTISMLVGNTKSVAKNIEELGFTPEVYSPSYRLVKEKDIKELHQQSVKVIPWTVNDVKEMQKLIDMGVDGLITDYPNRYFENFSQSQ